MCFTLFRCISIYGSVCPSVTRFFSEYAKTHVFGFGRCTEVGDGECRARGARERGGEGERGGGEGQRGGGEGGDEVGGMHLTFGVTKFIRV